MGNFNIQSFAGGRIAALPLLQWEARLPARPL